MQEQQKDDFIAVASHELRTPVTSIKAYAEILLEHARDSADDTSASMIERLSGQVDRLIKLIATLLDATQLRAGQLLLKIEQVDMNAVIRERIEDVKLLSSNHTIVFNAGSVRPLPAIGSLLNRYLPTS